MTEEAAAKVEVYEHGQLWVGSVQAAAALLGLLLLSGRRHRLGRALGFVAGNVRMGAVVSSIFFTAAAPGDLSNKMSNAAYLVVMVALELLGFIAHLLGQDDDDQ